MNTNVTAFCDVLVKDDALRQQLVDAARGDGERLLKAVVEAGAARGYAFTDDEACTFVQQAEELPDEVLDLVSAGGPVHCVISGDIPNA